MTKRCPNCGYQVKDKIDRLIDIIPEGEANAVPYVSLIPLLWGEEYSEHRRKTLGVYVSFARRKYKMEWDIVTKPDPALPRSANKRGAHRSVIWREGRKTNVSNAS